jgi:hypothetical protein
MPKEYSPNQNQNQNDHTDQHFKDSVQSKEKSALRGARVFPSLRDIASGSKFPELFFNSVQETSLKVVRQFQISSILIQNKMWPLGYKWSFPCLP